MSPNSYLLFFRHLPRRWHLMLIISVISAIVASCLYKRSAHESPLSSRQTFNNHTIADANESDGKVVKKIDSTSSRDSLSVDDLKSKLTASIERLSKLPYSRERQVELTKAGKQLGKLLGIRNSMEVVSDLFGPGKDRIWMINAVTSGTSEPVRDVISFLRSLEYLDDFHACMAGISMLVQSRKDFSPADLDGLSPPLSPEEVRVLANGLAKQGFESKAELDSKVAVAVAFIKSNVDKDKTEATLTEYFSTLSPFSPQGALEFWLDAMDPLNATFVESFPRHKLLASSIRNNPQLSMEKIEASLIGGDPLLKGRLAASALQQWMQIDANAAAAWATESDMHGDIVKSIAITPIFEHALHDGDLDTAKRWLEMINDPEIRKAAEGQVWSVERDIVRSEVSKNPVLALQTMVSDNSSHQDYWIEEAMGTWVAKDFDKANEWYQQNWKSLPPSKSQYIAAAFAKQAANQGDTTAAQKWATHIQDKKTKDRINSVIDKTESQPKP